MIRMSVMYPDTGGGFNMAYFLSDHLALVKRLLTPCGLVRVEVDKGINAGPQGDQAPYAVIAHLIFDNPETMQEGLKKHDPELAADTPEYTDIKPVFQISEMIDG